MKFLTPILACLAVLALCAFASAQTFLAPQNCPTCPNGVCPAPSAAPVRSNVAGVLVTADGRKIAPNGDGTYRFVDSGACQGGSCSGPATCGASGSCNSCSTCTASQATYVRRGLFGRRSYSYGSGVAVGGCSSCR